MNYRNPIWNNQGSIDLELEHPDLGWIPFTLTNEGEYAELYAEVTEGEVLSAATIPIEQERATWTLPRLIFKAILLEAGLLAQVNVLVQQSGDPMTILKWNEAAIFPRNDPLIDAIGPMLGLSPEAIDQMYRQDMALL